MGDGEKEEWIRVMRRCYPPFFAFLIGETLSKSEGFLNRAIVVYENGVCYWYILKERKESHGENICKEWIKKNYIKDRYDNSLELYDNIYEDNISLMEKFSALKKDGKINSNDFRSMVSHVFNNYYTIFDTIFGPSFKAIPKLEDEIPRILCTIESISDRTKEPYLNCQIKIGTLSVGGITPMHVTYEKEFLNLAIKMRTSLLSNTTMELGSKLIPERLTDYSPYEIMVDIEKKLKNELIARIKESPPIRKFTQDNAWLSWGWHTGFSLTNEYVATKCVDYILGENPPEVTLAQKEILYTLLEKKRNALIEKLHNLGTKKDINFKESGLKYADILMYDGLVREARRVIVGKIDYLTQRLMDEISSKIGVETEELYYLSPVEIEQSLLKEKIQLDEITRKKRKEMTFMLFDSDKDEAMVIEGESAVNKERIKRGLPPRAASTEIRGKVYFEWYPFQPVRGKPLILDKPTDVFNINSETIVISEMLEPQQAHFVEEAKGIITEDGSPSCHAIQIAIGKRIPLIVEAENIYSLFGKGQTVEEIILHTDGRIEEVKK